MARFVVTLTDGTLTVVRADRHRLQDGLVTFEERASADVTSAEQRWRQVCVLRGHHVARVELLTPHRPDSGGSQHRRGGPTA